ncbi:MAG: GAF domain-containing protein [Candidatus Eremiobacteraeota bacterium]|nr:GAF domain-containing protein [Candidatus Eremiobacteraeota bacterium]MBC5801522.1 GAF domain-containing protein [Candidatus Eremiobacteraeota bacterium]MBC5821085.1 GAF domain-containing protein [Candidatus Eremiobacteraeota bacterium]
MLDSERVVAGARELIRGERDPVANAANLAAFIMQSVTGLNWVGFYFVRGDELVLGPFAGKPAVTRIAPGRGVCGTAWARAQSVVVDDVDAIEEHIACDVASRAELVVPLLRDGAVFGVLDCDAPVRARFGDAERRLFETLAALYVVSSELDLSRSLGGG